jgi:hypothetical protein
VPKVVSVEVVVDSVVLEVVGPMVELVVDELVGGGVVLVVVLVVVVVVRFTRTVLLDGDAEVVVGSWWRLVRGGETGLTRLDWGTSVAVACAPRWRATAVVAGRRGSASARCRGVVTNPTTVPPIAPMSTAATTEAHRRDPT